MPTSDDEGELIHYNIENIVVLREKRCKTKAQNNLIFLYLWYLHPKNEP